MNQETRPSVLVIDDETNLLRFFEYNIRGMGYDVYTGETGADLRSLITQRQYHAVLLDMMLPDANGMDLLGWIHQMQPELPVVLITAYGTIESAVESMKLGAVDFLAKPVEIARLRASLGNAVEQSRLRNEVRTLRRRLDPPQEYYGMIGQSPSMLEIYNMIDTVAPTTATVMITGESGTGKELVARAIHEASPRTNRPFIAINCAAIARDLLESELFGHERGAFTGAVERVRGCFERADGGTLFLDEICEMDLSLQAKLLRVIQERAFYRVGGSTAISVDVRIISATNQDPVQAVRESRFREDLFYRLNVVPVHLPPLRERREDISLLSSKFLLEFSKVNERQFQGFDIEALGVLESCRWDGNVRELRNMIEHIVVLNQGERVTREMLPEALRSHAAVEGEESPAASTGASLGGRLPIGALPSSPDRIRPFWQVERDQIQAALDLCAGNVQEVARRLELSPATLYRKIEKYGLVK